MSPGKLNLILFGHVVLAILALAGASHFPGGF